MNKLVLSFILRDVEHFFSFLLARGYRIRDAQYFPEINGNWAVNFESMGCNIEISSDRDVINLAFAPTYTTQDKTRISIEAMIYFLTEGREVVGDFEGNFAWGKRKQLERMASLLRAYIDQIEPYFGNDFEKYKDDLTMVQKRYNALLLKGYVGKMKGPKT